MIVNPIEFYLNKFGKLNTFHKICSKLLGHKIDQIRVRFRKKNYTLFFFATFQIQNQIRTDQNDL